MTVTIQAVTAIDECRHIEKLQKEIWTSTDLEVAPDHLLLTIAKEDGVVLLARTETGKPVGFAYGFLARTKDGRLKLASHQAGVLAAYQDDGVGYALKLAQRQATLDKRLDLITWTYDPLQGRNAYFNLHKLGAVCQTYLANLYGEMRDELNQGLPSDRFRVDWWIASAAVAERLAGQSPDYAVADYPILNQGIPLGEGLVAPANTFEPAHSSACLVEIPADINELKSTAPAVALQWRRQTRAIFEQAFAVGYTAVDVLRYEDRNYYLLQKD